MDDEVFPVLASVHFERAAEHVREMFIGTAVNPSVLKRIEYIYKSCLMKSFAQQCSVIGSSPMRMADLSEALDRIEVSVRDGHISLYVPPALLDDLDKWFGTMNLRAVQDVHES